MRLNDTWINDTLIVDGRMIRARAAITPVRLIVDLAGSVLTTRLTILVS
jgi:hypothetical protein